jgi:hypothetical protein
MFECVLGGFVMSEGAALAQEPEIPRISKEDAWAAIEVVRKALALRPFIKEGIFREKWLQLSKEQQMEEFLNPRISIFYPDENRLVPAIYMRMTSDEGPLAEAFFYPIEAAWSFLQEARETMAPHRPTDWTDKEFEENAESEAVNMLLMMIDNLYKRTQLMMDSFTMETIAQWHADRNRDIHRYWAGKGDMYPKPKETFLDGMLKIYSREVRQLWKYQGQTHDDWRKMRLAEEYEPLLKHWRRLYKMVIDDDPDWREYAKAGNYADTPDDLLKKLENVDRSSEESIATRVSELALEHSSRRVGLIKRSGVNEWALQKRKEGILVSDYSGTQLFALLKEGKEVQLKVAENKKVQQRIATYPTPEGGESNPALEKKRKSLKQKLKFIKEKSEESVEPEDGSAQPKKD